MAFTVAGTLDRDAVVRAAREAVDLAGDPMVARAWTSESALPGMTVGGLARHLVSQPESAVEFLEIPVPAGTEPVSLDAWADRVDWLLAPRLSPENTSIRDDFNEMAEDGYAAAVAAGEGALAALPGAIDAAGPVTFVPWQECVLATDDFLLCRLVEIVVHADDLAASIGVPTPAFDRAVLDPVVAFLGVLALRRHGQDAVVRALARTERAAGPTSAF